MRHGMLIEKIQIPMLFYFHFKGIYISETINIPKVYFLRLHHPVLQFSLISNRYLLKFISHKKTK